MCYPQVDQILSVLVKRLKLVCTRKETATTYESVISILVLNSIPKGLIPDFLVKLEEVKRRSEKLSLKERYKKILEKLKRLPIEYSDDFDPDQDFDTRVKLPAWQTERLRKRAAGKDWRK